MFKHHGPALGGVPNTRGDPVRRFMRASHFDALQEGEETPDVWIFAHWHNFFTESIRVQSPSGVRDIQTYYCPPLTFPDKRTLNVVPRLERVDIGVLALDVEDGKIVEVHEWFKRYSLRKIIKH